MRYSWFLLSLVTFLCSLKTTSTWHLHHRRGSPRFIDDEFNAKKAQDDRDNVGSSGHQDLPSLRRSSHESDPKKKSKDEHTPSDGSEKIEDDFPQELPLGPPHHPGKESPSLPKVQGDASIQKTSLEEEIQPVEPAVAHGKYQAQRDQSKVADDVGAKKSFQLNFKGKDGIFTNPGPAKKEPTGPSLYVDPKTQEIVGTSKGSEAKGQEEAGPSSQKHAGEVPGYRKIYHDAQAAVREGYKRPYLRSLKTFQRTPKRMRSELEKEFMKLPGPQAKAEAAKLRGEPPQQQSSAQSLSREQSREDLLRWAAQIDEISNTHSLVNIVYRLGVKKLKATLKKEMGSIMKNLPVFGHRGLFTADYAKTWKEEDKNFMMALASARAIAKLGKRQQRGKANKRDTLRAGMRGEIMALEERVRMLGDRYNTTWNPPLKSDEKHEMRIELGHWQSELEMRKTQLKELGNAPPASPSGTKIFVLTTTRQEGSGRQREALLRPGPREGRHWSRGRGRWARRAGQRRWRRRLRDRGVEDDPASAEYADAKRDHHREQRDGRESIERRRDHEPAEEWVTDRERCRALIQGMTTRLMEAPAQVPVCPNARNGMA